MNALHGGRRLRVGVVGLGEWGQEHVRSWRDIPGVDLVAVCDKDRARAADVAASWGIEQWYDSSSQLAQHASLDAVSIVSDEKSRLEATLPLIDARVHVLVEKPMGLDLPTATRIVEAAAQAGVLLMPSHPLRFDSRFAMLKERIHRGDLGAVRSIYCRRMIPRDRYAKYSRAHPALMAAIHDIDLARWYFDEEPRTVRSFGNRLRDDPVPDIVWTVLTFRRSGIAVIETAWSLPVGAGLWLESETEVIGSAGVARINTPSEAVGLWLSSGHEQPDTTLAGASLGRAWGSLKDELSYFASCILHGKQHERVTAEDGVRALAVALAMVESLALGGAEVPCWSDQPDGTRTDPTSGSTEEV
jgi:UDP-N-acetylglucosamine 3-dehydrogenase